MAQSFLGVLYVGGHGVPQDYEKARQWWEQAASQGNGSAQILLGEMYADGKGVPQDYGKARQWYEKAAVHGFAMARYYLAVLYANGQGVPQDYVRAYMWYSLTAGGKQGPAADNRDEIARLMTPEQIAEAQRLAQQCQAQQFKGC